MRRHTVDVYYPFSLALVPEGMFSDVIYLGILPIMDEGLL